MKKWMDVGRVSSIYPERCTARVYFEDKNMVSRELQVAVRGAQNNKDFWMPAIGEQVICLFSPNGNGEGFIIGAVYNDEDKPPVQTEKKRHIQFEDGAFFEYDVSNHVLTLDFSKVSGAKVILKNCQLIES
ncbi:phage baseplate assembly protein V [Thermaerobacillus caldiproteolyticus]|uniref:phage baseplate assembly protein V n=1 Tax=Thermaerobacillus caldiproteolyticus TaxID=247480 RepID=UPI00188D937F|nr:phage baseplate assembly protein V [Anoxybacillus caldiproteolyticus]QPA33368.1 phage baseplate assembly protein V [Anoxybacillus caldiproteolyticus]